MANDLIIATTGSLPVKGDKPGLPFKRAAPAYHFEEFTLYRLDQAFDFAESHDRALASVSAKKANDE